MNKTNCSKSDEQSHSNFLVLSNLSYLLPIGATIYMWNSGKLQSGLAIEIILLLIGIMMISWVYHSCRKQATAVIDPCQDNIDASVDCVKCSAGTSLQWVNTNIGISEFADRLISQYVTILIITYVLPLKYTIKATIRVTCLIAIIFLLLAGVNEYVSLLPCLLVSAFVLNPMTLINSKYMSKSQLILVSLLSVVSLTAFGFFIIPKNKYWLYHSLWHIFGAFSAGIAIMLSSSFYDIPDSQFGAEIYHAVTEKGLLSPNN
jgi:hypothetical protein